MHVYRCTPIEALYDDAIPSVPGPFPVPDADNQPENNTPINSLPDPAAITPVTGPLPAPDADDQPKNNTLVIAIAIVVVAALIVVGVAVPLSLWIAGPTSISAATNAELGSFDLFTHIHSKHCMFCA